MSRSALAARFTELVGEPAMQYVTRWRMHTAYTLLTDGGATVSELAGRLGYRSEAVFSRAFKRVVGVAPGAARRGTFCRQALPLTPRSGPVADSPDREAKARARPPKMAASMSWKSQ